MLIQCIQGHAVTDIMGQKYSFQRNRHGDFVAEVENIRHQECLLNASYAYKRYEEPATEEAEEPKDQAPAPEPVGLDQAADDDFDPTDNNADVSADDEQVEDAEPTPEPAPADETPADDAALADDDAGEPDADAIGKPLDEMSKDELKAEAERRGVKITARMNKDAIVEAILASED